MHSALWVSKTGMAAQDAKLTAISNNLANVNTIGFKKDKVVFEDLLYSVHKQAGVETTETNRHPTGVQFGSGVKILGTEKINTQGSALTTNLQYDMAIEGEGFFQIETTTGETVYTRNGQFRVNAEGLIVNGSGNPLVPNITVPAEAISVAISNDGIVSASIPGQADNEELGQITVARFNNPQGLRALGGNLLAETQASGEANILVAGEEGAGYLRQGVLEGSNVQVVEEMVEMISTQRAYEMNVKMVSAADQMLQYIAQHS
ncbi:flagellar basal-body rod protein FlgG [Vibrio barjaei]|uniref:flagellar basal-body rod protein FlgG n=1 Tax=Vibrio barjaei TaxID=1676683 RepID=UPI002284C3B1|nr:flagellar basal-body rod protein FlgG [Vibrio barjaei]MCY9872315.1 flagellar basal-body rod protein FlgG [Vibrio barjaei]